MRRSYKFESECFEQHGYAIVPGFVRRSFLETCRSFISTIDDAEWTFGNQTTHRWREFGKPCLLPLEKAVNLISLQAICGTQIVRQFQWINYFEQGQFVERHKDAGGDAHLLIPIEIPDRHEGGQFWLRHKKAVLPVGVGDALLLRAHRIPHGTTAITSKGKHRVTFNARLWLL